MDNNTPVKCTRCKNTHKRGDRVEKRNLQLKGVMAFDLVCPRCGCKSFYDLSREED